MGYLAKAIFEMKKQNLKIKSEPLAKVIRVIFSLKTFEQVVKSLAMTKMCHGEILMEDAKAMHKIVMALAAGKDSVSV